MGLPFSTNITLTNEVVKSLSPVYPALILVWLNAPTQGLAKYTTITKEWIIFNSSIPFIS